MHEAEHYLAVAGAVGAKTKDKRLVVPLSEADHRQAWQLLYEHETPQNIRHPIIAMHPGSGGYSTARRWAPERFAQLADTLYSSVRGQLLLLGGPEEAELPHLLDHLVRVLVGVLELEHVGHDLTREPTLERVEQRVNGCVLVDGDHGDPP